jgi:hypothetical protein
MATARSIPILILLALALLVRPPHEAHASSPGPDRDLLPAELLSIRVAGADAIVIGSFGSVYDTTVARGFGPADGVARFSIVQVHATRVLRGFVCGRDFPLVLWGDNRAQPVGLKAGTRSANQPGGRGPMLLFLRDLTLEPRVPATSYLGAAQRSARWAPALPRDPTMPPEMTDWTAAVEQDVRAEIARQTPEALTRAADVIVVGRLPYAGSPRALEGDQPIRVERILKGANVPTSLHVRFVQMQVSNGSSLLLFLKRVGGGRIEPIGPTAGIVELSGSRVPRWGSTVEEAIARIQATGAPAP